MFKKIWIIRLFLAYFAALYVTVLLLKLAECNTRHYTIGFKNIILNIFIVVIMVFNVRYFFKRFFLSKDAVTICFYPVKFEKIFLLEFLKNQIWVILIASIYGFARVLSCSTFMLVMWEFCHMYVFLNIFTLLFLILMMIIILSLNIREIHILIMERVLYCVSIIGVPYIFVFFKKISFAYEVVFLLCNISILLLINITIYRKLFERIVEYSYEAYTKKGDFFNRHGRFTFMKMNPYIQIEIKRYCRLWKIVVSSIIQNVILSCVLLTMYGTFEGDRFRFLFVIINIVAASNFFSTTSWSSEEQNSYMFLPIHISKLIFAKVVVASFFHGLFFSIIYCGINIFYSRYIKIQQFFLYCVMLGLVIIYSLVGCLLDFVSKREVHQDIDLIYGNFPKLILLLLSVAISNFIYAFLII